MSSRIRFHAVMVSGLMIMGIAVASVRADNSPQRQKQTSPHSVKNLQLKVSANGRYFVDQNGKPFFYLGDTCWLLFQRPNREELDEYLQDRVRKGFTVMQAYVIRGLGEQHPDGNRSLLGQSPFIDRDPTKPNEAFFMNVDYVVNRANELGLVMGLVTSKSWHVNKHAEQIFNRQNAYTFGRFLGERYQNNAVMWYPGGDSPPGEDRETWLAMVKGLKDGSGGRQLISYHGQGHTSSSIWFHKEAWLDFNSIQSGHGWAAKTYEYIVKDYGLSPAKPTVDMEPPYENHPTGKTPRIDSHQVRQGAYWNMLAGAAGHGYGSLDLFWFYKDSDGPFPKNSFQHWRKAMAYEGSGQMRHMRRLFELRPWYTLVPDQSVLASGPGNGADHIQAARDKLGSWVIAYVPNGKPDRMHMDKLSGPTVRATWYDPRQGTWKEIGQYPNQKVREFQPPSQGEKEDWVLVLDDAAKKYPTGKGNDDKGRIPEAVFKSFATAVKKDDVKTAMSHLTCDSQSVVAGLTLVGALLDRAFSRPLFGGPLSDKDKEHIAAIDKVLQKHGFSQDLQKIRPGDDSKPSTDENWTREFVRIGGFVKDKPSFVTETLKVQTRSLDDNLKSIGGVNGISKAKVKETKIDRQKAKSQVTFTDPWDEEKVAAVYFIMENEVWKIDLMETMQNWPPIGISPVQAQPQAHASVTPTDSHPGLLRRLLDRLFNR